MRERDSAIADHDGAVRNLIAALAKAEQERDAYERELHILQAGMAILDGERKSEANTTQNQLDMALAKSIENQEVITSLRDDVERWQSSCEKLQLENTQLSHENQIKNEKLAVYEQRQVEIHDRVLALEYRMGKWYKHHKHV
jgi:chromosome segregation ATPase